jgi:citrate lyase subunit beta/citryl-CoA lyase
MLFVPGNNLRMIVKIPKLTTDAVILDLEDAVSLDSKETARIFVRDSVKAIKISNTYVFVRVNAFNTGLLEKDLNSVVVKGLDGIMLPKTEEKSDVMKLASSLRQFEKKLKLKRQSFKIIPLVETAKGVKNVYEIASASKRIIAVAFGAGDYCSDLGRNVTSLSNEQTELLYARSRIVNDSRANHIPAIDAPFFGLLTDKNAFEKETKQGYKIGFAGKLLIHPNQIESANKIFSPAKDEIEYAEKVITVFNKAKAKGLGAASLEGKMIDEMSYKQAKALLNFANTIADKEKQQTQNQVSLFEFF